MTILRLQRIHSEVQAQQVTAKNIYEVSKWCGGSIRGTRLPPEEQEIELWVFDSDQRAKVGDWIIREGGNHYVMENRFIFDTFYNRPLTSD